MEKRRINVQIQPVPLKRLDEEMTLRATSCTQLGIEIEQPPQEKGKSIQELVEKHTNEGKIMVNMSFEGQHESFPSNLEVIRKEKYLSHNDEITSRNNKLEKLQGVENDAQELKVLVANENESTSQESLERTREVVKTIPKMAPWGEMYEEFKISQFPRCRKPLFN